jgi:hypothetical protein
MKTAVEWLVEEINQKIDYIPLNKWDMIRDIVLQAKEMEKEQIINAYIEASANLEDIIKEEAENYYKKTFK